MGKSRNFLSIAVPSATVFFSSACIMVLELVAGRLIARHLGSSLYTWTSVIGVVLAGITVGNWLGGRIADRFKPTNAMSVLFIICSAACVVTVALNNLAGEWIWLWYLSWPVRVFLHVFLVFMLPSTLLGTISPVVAKMALERGLPTGRTVGDIYAWGAAGSIAGTFAAGYFLIAAMGTVAIIWTVAGVLMLMGLLYGARRWIVPASWVVLFGLLLSMGVGPWQWCAKAGAAVGLRAKPDPAVVYEDDTQYCHVEVRRVSGTGDKRKFMQDKLMHSEIDMEDRDNLLYFHTVVFAAVTHGLTEEGQALSVMHIGGGGYVFPQYIEKNWPESRNDVVEIDPGVTEAAMQAFGLARDTTVNTIQMDARRYVDELIRMKQAGKETPEYDFIYEDAFSDYSVPFQLVTKEFNDKIYEVMTDDGVYIINSIDVYDSALFIGSYVYTLEQTFPYVYVVCPRGPRSDRTIFVIIASKRQLDPTEYELGGAAIEPWYLTDEEMEDIKKKGKRILLTDDYVPVENMLAPVVRVSARDLLVGRLQDNIGTLKQKGSWEELIEAYLEIIELDPTMSILAYNEIAMANARQGRMEKAVESFRSALEYNENAEFKDNMASVHLSLGTALRQLKRNKEAAEQFQKAIEGYRRQLQKDDTSVKMWMLLGDTLATTGNFKEGSECFARAVELDPDRVDIRMKLAQALEFHGRFDEALSAIDKAILTASRSGNQQLAQQLTQYRAGVELKKSKSPR
jgi:tetratricopeptide (TPR) repeat protein